MAGVLLIFLIGSGIASFYSQTLALIFAFIPLVFIGSMYWVSFSPIKIRGLNLADDEKDFFDRYSYYFAYRVAYEYWQAIAILIFIIAVLNLIFFEYTKSPQFWVPLVWALFAVASFVFYLRFVPSNIKKSPMRKMYESVLEKMKHRYKNILISEFGDISQKLEQSLQSSNLEADDLRALYKFSKLLEARNTYLGKESTLPLDKEEMRTVIKRNKDFLDAVDINGALCLDCLETFVPDKNFEISEKNLEKVMNILCTQMTNHYERSSLVYTDRQRAFYLDVAMAGLNQEEEVLCERILSICSSRSKKYST